MISIIIVVPVLLLWALSLICNCYLLATPCIFNCPWITPLFLSPLGGCEQYCSYWSVILVSLCTNDIVHCYTFNYHQCLRVSKAAEERGWRLQAATLHYKHSLFLPCPYFHFGLLGLWEDVLTTWAWIGELVGLRHREDERAMESDGLICGSPTRIDWLFCQQWFL